MRPWILLFAHPHFFYFFFLFYFFCCFFFVYFKSTTPGMRVRLRIGYNRLTPAVSVSFVLFISSICLLSLLTKQPQAVKEACFLQLFIPENGSAVCLF
jgi:hypothetical protein